MNYTLNSDTAIKNFEYIIVQFEKEIFLVGYFQVQKNPMRPCHRCLIKDTFWLTRWTTKNHQWPQELASF